MMIRHYLKISVRNLMRDVGFSTINIVGLALGLSCCLLISVYVRFELSYENFHEKKGALYRYIPRGERDGSVYMQTLLPLGFAPLMKEHFREIEMYSRFSNYNSKPLLRAGESHLPAKRLAAADNDFFRMFSFPLTRGNVDHVLSRPFSIAIAESVANDFFPGGDAIGKMIRYDNTFDLEVTAVFKDIPPNSHIQFTYVTSFETVASMMQARYGTVPAEFLSDLTTSNYSTYFYIPTTTHLDSLAQRMDRQFAESRNVTFNANAIPDWLQPIETIHFTRGIRWDTANGNKAYVYIFSGAAVLILIIACFNFMNLSTARAIRRSKEIAMRKVLGAIRLQLMGQFLGESFLIVTIASSLSLLVLPFLVNALNAVMNMQLEIIYFGATGIVWNFVLIILVTSILSGAYPAFYLSSFAPIRILKGAAPQGNVGLRKLLMTFQFGIATMLVICTLVVYMQLSYVGERDLGFQKDAIIYFDAPADVWSKRDVLKQKLLAESGVEGVTFSNGAPGIQNSYWNYSFPGQAIPSRSVNTFIVDYDFVKTFDLEVISGRDLNRSNPSDSIESYLVNETFVNDLMIADPIGFPIQATDGHPPGRIIGVIKDFHYQSLHRRIEPVVLRIDPRNMWCISVRLGEGRLSDNLKKVEQQWRSMASGYPFSFEFLDESLAIQYRAEESTGLILGSFSSMSVLIACLGLLAMISFLTEQRRKEIGIRKVLGASVATILLMLSRDFIRLMSMALIIVIPVAWYSSDTWLQAFAYRTSVSPIVYLGAGLTLAAISWLTIAYHASKAAHANPCDSLRNE